MTIRDHRNTGREAAADRVLSALTPQLARDPNGHVVKVPRDQPLKPGWIAIEPDAMLDSERDREIYGCTKREQLHHDLDAQAHELRRGWYRANRPAFWDGGELIIPMDNDLDVLEKNPTAFDPDRIRKEQP